MPHKDPAARRAYHAQYHRDHPEKWDYSARKDAINARRKELRDSASVGRPNRRTTHGKTHTTEYALWSGAKKRALKNGLPFSLGMLDVPDIPALCPVLGIPIIQGLGARRATDNSPSLDRIVPRLGYAPGNVRVVSWRANRLRNDATAEELRLIADDAKRLETSHA